MVKLRLFNKDIDPNSQVPIEDCWKYSNTYIPQRRHRGRPVTKYPTPVVEALLSYPGPVIPKECLELACNEGRLSVVKLLLKDRRAQRGDCLHSPCVGLVSGCA